jgi:hypothetical protein
VFPLATLSLLALWFLNPYFVFYEVSTYKAFSVSKNCDLIRNMYLQIPVTVVILANTEITIQGAIIRQIRHAYKSTGSDGAVAAANVVLVVDDKADGDSGGAGHIRLQADGKNIRVGDALDAKQMLILDIEEVGDFTRV